VTRAARRYYRTIVLGVVALAALVWVAMDQFGISRGEMAELFAGTVIVALLVIAVAGLTVLLWMGLRRLLRGKPD
jgi:hypothetical protein